MLIFRLDINLERKLQIFCKDANFTKHAEKRDKTKYKTIQIETNMKGCTILPNFVQFKVSNAIL